MEKRQSEILGLRKDLADSKEGIKMVLHKLLAQFNGIFLKSIHFKREKMTHWFFVWNQKKKVRNPNFIA